MCCFSCASRFLLAFILFSGLLSDALYARNDREGFNFGLSGSWSSSKGDDRGEASSLVEKSQDSRRHGVFHFGYAFDEVINLGLNFAFISDQRSERLLGESSGEVIDRQTESDLRSYGLFFRFLFGRYFYFELGGGAYDYRNGTKTEFVSQVSGNQFNSVIDESQVRGVGPGYHAAAGIEIPLKYGFFVTGNYRFLQYATTVSGNNSAATKRSGQSDEIVFGIHHYTD